MDKKIKFDDIIESLLYRAAYDIATARMQFMLYMDTNGLNESECEIEVVNTIYQSLNVLLKYIEYREKQDGMV